jgi:tetratricopeptide (TPR) repeat protein
MSNENLKLKEAFDLAAQNHQQGKIDIAEDFYNQVLKINPNHVDANNNLGTIYHRLGNYQKSKDCYEKVIKLNPDSTDALNNLGALFFAIGKNHEAISYYKKAIKLNPNLINSYYNLGNVLFEIGEYQKSKNCYEKVIKLNANHAEAYNDLGRVLLKLKENQRAIISFKKAIDINPNSIRAQKSITNFYISNLNNFDKAISESHKNLKVYNKSSMFINQIIPLFRLKHDVEQAKYLSSKNYKIDGIDEFQKMGNEILNREENKYNDYNVNKKILLTPDEVNTLLPFYKADQIYTPKIIQNSCINPNKNWQEVEDEYLNSSNQIMYIDDFLSDEALIELREFCLVSKVWNKEYYNPFLGAYSDNGFISPIHLQIAVDLKKKLPKIFGPHNLGKFWGFKYDSTLGKGINIHADFAIHNLNFWITPDEYNNNKKSGGLKVYDAPAPEHWTFRDYNTQVNKIYNFLKKNNSKYINIPYKFNRAVLFNSAYFHETDEIDFKDEYEGRRINNTYLFGSRLVKYN